MRAFRNVVAYMGFGFYWAWIFVSFNSVGSLGQDLSIDALASSHLASSVAAILPLLAVFLLRGKIEALPHRALFALVVSSSVLASVSTACMQAFFAQPIMYAAAAASAGLFVVGPMLAWGVVYGSLDAKNAVSAPLFRSRLRGLFISLHRLCHGPSPLWLRRRCPSLPDLAHARAFPEARIALSGGKAAFPKSLLLIRPSPSEPWLGLRW